MSAQKKHHTHPAQDALHTLYQITLILALLPIACAFKWNNKKEDPFKKESLTVFGHIGLVVWGLIAIPCFVLHQLVTRIERIIRWCCQCTNKQAIWTDNALLKKFLMWPVWTATALILLIPAVIYKGLSLTFTITKFMAKSFTHWTQNLLTRSFALSVAGTKVATNHFISASQFLKKKAHEISVQNIFKGPATPTKKTP